MLNKYQIFINNSKLPLSMIRRTLATLLLGATLTAVPAAAQSPKLTRLQFDDMGVTLQVPDFRSPGGYTLKEARSYTDSGFKVVLEGPGREYRTLNLELEVRTYMECSSQLSIYLSPTEKAAMEAKERAGKGTDTTIFKPREVWTAEEVSASPYLSADKIGQPKAQFAMRCVQLPDHGVAASVKALIPSDQLESGGALTRKVFESLELTDTRSPVPSSYVPFVNNLTGCGEENGRRPSSGMRPSNWTVEYARNGVDGWTKECSTTLTSPSGSKLIIIQEELDARIDSNRYSLQDVAEAALIALANGSGSRLVGETGKEFSFSGTGELWGYSGPNVKGPYDRQIHAAHSPNTTSFTIAGNFINANDSPLYAAVTTMYHSGSGRQSGKYVLPRSVNAIQIVPDNARDDISTMNRILRTLRF